VRTGHYYGLRTLKSVDDEAPVYVIQTENRTSGLSARGRASRDLEETERIACGDHDGRG
jgi:hypothetical protein